MRIDPFYILKMLPNMAAATVALQFGFQGHNNTTITACAASTQAIGEAFEVVRRGRAEVMLTGGTEAGISELGLAALLRHARALDPQRRADEGQPPLRQRPRRLRLRGGRRDPGARKPGARPTTAARRSWRSWPATAPRPTPTTRSRPAKTAPARCAR